MTLAWPPTLSTHRSTDIGWRRSRKRGEPHARQRAASAFHAAASPARSLSVKDSADDLGRRLAEIDRLGEIVERWRRSWPGVHGSRPALAGQYALDRRRGRAL